MSLRETYHLACSAQSRLTRELARPDRNLRRMVGHLAHYESLRTRIADMESTTAAASAGHVSFTISTAAPASQPRSSSSSSSSNQSSSRAPSPPPSPRHFTYDDDEDEDAYENEDDYEDDDYFYDQDADFDCAELSLTRCPSRSVSPPPPELDADDSSDDSSDGESDDEPACPPRYELAAAAAAPRARKGPTLSLPLSMTTPAVQVA